LKTEYLILATARYWKVPFWEIEQRADLDFIINETLMMIAAEKTAEQIRQKKGEQLNKLRKGS
jgi:hypothetical protein